MSAACIGCFDGVHLGHQKIIQTTVQIAKEQEIAGKALSILHPWASFFPNFPGLIYPITKRFELIRLLGIDLIEELDLSCIKDMSPERFVRSIVDSGVKVVVVGHDFTFGSGASGNVSTLTELSPKLGYDFIVVPEVVRNSRKVSSSWIRELLAQGSVEKASSLLGRHYSVSGTVYRDKHLGTKLGFPTANIATQEESLASVRPGVYVVSSVIAGDRHFGVLNAGFRPTVNPSKQLKYEAHFFGFSDDLYHRSLEIEFLHFLRPELKFDSVSELVRRVSEDMKSAKAWIKKNSPCSKTLP